MDIIINGKVGRYAYVSVIYVLPGISVLHLGTATPTRLYSFPMGHAEKHIWALLWFPFNCSAFAQFCWAASLSSRLNAVIAGQQVCVLP